MTRLADKLIAIPFGHGFLSTFGYQVAAAQHFEIGNDVRDACFQVLQSKPSSLLSALPLIRLPYANTWVEWQEHVPDSGAARVGYLINSYSNGNNRGSMRYSWLTKDGTIAVSPTSVMFEWGLSDPSDVFGKFNISEAPITAAINYIRRSPSWAKYLTSPLEIDAVHQIGRHIALCRDQGTPEDYHGMDSHLIPFIMAFLVMLNSNRAMITAKDDFSRLNKRRAASGKPLLREFTVTRLNLTRCAANRASALGISRETARKHLVRGHFKVRRSGIFWWAPFIRGIGSPVTRSHYEVTN